MIQSHAQDVRNRTVGPSETMELPHITPETED
jgi:hypothetical protein